MYVRRVIDTEAELIRALCADYERRAEALISGRLSHATEMQYKYLNYKIYDAAAETVGEALAEIYVKEIGFSTGYADTRVEAVSETTYKRDKKRVREAIARKLNLSS